MNVYVDLEQLHKHNACQYQTEVFMHTFPSGKARLNKPNVRKAMKAGIALRWLALWLKNYKRKEVGEIYNLLVDIDMSWDLKRVDEAYEALQRLAVLWAEKKATQS